MTEALRARIEDLEETVRQLRAAFSPNLPFPAAWRLVPRDRAILAALYNARGSAVGWEALLLFVEGPATISIDTHVRAWISALRAKVEPFGITVETHRSAGYSLSLAGRRLVSEAIGDVLVAASDEPARPADTPNARRTGWTDREDEILRAGYARTATLSCIRVELTVAGFRARSLSSISNRAATLGVESARAFNRWAEPEDRILRQGYADGVTLHAIRLRLAAGGHSRNRGAIQMRAIALGLSGDRAKLWTQPERAIVRAGLHAGDTHATIIERLAEAGYERGRTAVAKLARMMGSRRAAPAWTEADDDRLRAFYADRTPLRDIAIAMHRKAGGIACRASKLGIHQREPRRPALARPAAFRPGEVARHA